MLKQRVLVTVALVFVTVCGLTDGRKQHFSPIQAISPEEYETILNLSQGKSTISEARLIGSGLSAISSIASNIKNGAISALNMTGLESFYSSIFGHSANKLEGYPLCVIRTNKYSRRSVRSYGSNNGNSQGFSITFGKPGQTSNTNTDEDNTDDDTYYSYHPTRPSRRPHRPSRPSYSQSGNSDDSDSSAPIVNCVVVLKPPKRNSTTSYPTYPTYPSYPSYPSNPHYPGYTTTTTTTTTTPKPHYPHHPYNPHGSNYPVYPYPIIPFPIPAYPSYPGWPSNPHSPPYSGSPWGGHNDRKMDFSSSSAALNSEEDTASSGFGSVVRSVQAASADQYLNRLRSSYLKVRPINDDDYSEEE